MLWFVSSVFALIGSAVSLIFGAVWFVLTIVARWMVFQKAGEPGWKSIIPFYSDYTAYKIAWTPSMYWVWLICYVVDQMAGNAANGHVWSMLGMLSMVFGVASAVISLVFAFNLAKSFGRGILFGIGLWLFEPLFLMILGFGSAQYQRYYR